MDEDITLHSHQQKIILHKPGMGGAGEEEIVVQLQETMFVSEVEESGETVAVHGFTPQELVIQDDLEDVVAEYVHSTEEEEDEEVAMETCVMALEEDEGLQVDSEKVLLADANAQDGLVDEEQHSCEDFLMISLDETDKVHDGDTDPGLDHHGEEHEGQEVIKVYIFKADAKDNDSEVSTGMMDAGDQEQMVYVSTDESCHDQSEISVLQMADKEYVGVVVDGEETDAPEHLYNTVDHRSPSHNMSAFSADEGSLEDHGHRADGEPVQERSGLCAGAKQQMRNRQYVELRQVQTAIILGPNGQPITVFPCMLCGKKFKSHGFLKRHTRNNHQDVLNRKKFQCSDCDFSTNKKSSLHSHMQEHSLKVKAALECEECGQEFLQQAALHLHRQQHRQLLKCKFCEYESAEQGLLNRHVLAAHSKNFPHSCVECGKGFRHPSELRKHMRTHTGEKPYRCTSCQYKSSDSSNLKMHMKAKHGSETAQRCQRCAQTFSTQEELQEHEFTHDEAKLHQCSHCDHKSSNSSDLKRHVISAHTRDYPHACAVCGKGFHRPSELRKHAASHRAPRRAHQCRHCSFRTADPFALSRHVLSTHSREQQEPPEEQTFPGSQPQNDGPQPEPEASPEADAEPEPPAGSVVAPAAKGKRAGAKAPREKRVYQCQYCDYSTGDASGFKRHVISIHTKDYPHRCQYCSKGFRRPSEKNQHIMRHHKDVLQSEPEQRGETL